MVDSLSNATWAARALLENFELVAHLHVAMVPRGAHMEGFREDVRAAAIASILGLKSVDYAIACGNGSERCSYGRLS